MKKIKYRGIYKGSARIFLAWGTIVVLKGLYDVFWGMPESEFVTAAKWSKYTGFEIVYGLACMLMGLIILEFCKRVPEYLERN